MHSLKVWRVDHGNLVEVEEEHFGLFFGGDSYVIKYTYNGDAPKYIIYFWQVKLLNWCLYGNRLIV